MPPLPIPTQQPPRPQKLPYNPFLPQGSGGGGTVNPMLPAPVQPQTDPNFLNAAPAIFEYLRSLGQSMEGFDPVIQPGTPWGGAKRAGGQALDLLTMPARGALSAPANARDMAAGPFYEDLQTTFGAKYQDPRLQGFAQSAPLPGMEDLLREQLVAQTANPGGITRPELDFTSTIQGLPIPEAPPKRAPTIQAPDFTAADARYDKAKPKAPVKSTDKLTNFLEGASEASAQLDPYNDTWSSSLAKIVGGGARGIREARERQENLELQYEADMRQYELMRAGIDAQRAAAESQLALERTRLEIAAEQQSFENNWRRFEALQPSVHANSDGSLIVTTRGQDGQISVQRMGFEEALQNRIAVEQAKNLGGKGAEAAARLRIQQHGGPNARVAEAVTDMIGRQQDSLLIPPGTPAYDAYVAGVAKDDQNLINMGLDGDNLEAKMAEVRFQRLMQLIYANPQVRDHAIYTLFGIQPQKANPLPPPPQR